MAEKANDFKLDDLDQLLNCALNELNNPSIIQDTDAPNDETQRSALDKSEELNQLTDTFKKLMDSSNENGFDENVLDEIRRFEENLKANMQNLPDDADEANEEEMAKLWEQLNSQTENGEDFFPPFFMDIMQKLLAKDVLYPPLKELSTKFPDWLSENRETLSEEDYERYKKQHELVDQVCGYYEEEDTDGPIESKRFQKILTAMQEMQLLGQPPEALMVNGQNPAGFQPTSMEEFNELNKMMGGEGGPDQCKTM